MPAATSAQFIPKEEAIKRINDEEARDLKHFIERATQRRDAANRRLQTVFSQVKSRKISVSQGERSADVIIADLKAELSELLNSYAKKTTVPGGVRAARDTAQDMLDEMRRNTSDTLNNFQLTAEKHPNQLTGDYLEFKKNLDKIIDNALTWADKRLADPGTKKTALSDLDQVVQTTQKKLNLRTAQFLKDHPKLLPSAIERIQKQAQEKFKKEMVARYDAGKQRSNDKALDLGPNETKELEEIRTEMIAVVQRATTTAEQVLQQTQGVLGNLPTGSQAIGVNPQLETKFKAIEQIEALRKTAVSRIESRREEISNSNKSKLFKQVAAKDFDQYERQLSESFDEYKAYFSAGDPSQGEYEASVQNAQKDAKGCTSFFCNVGRFVSGAASAVVGAKTGIPVPSNAVSSGLFGIKDPHYVQGKYVGTAASGALPYVNGQYVTPGGGYGGQAVGAPNYDPRCYSMSTPSEKGPKFSFIEKAHAQEGDSSLIDPKALGDDLPSAAANAVTGTGFSGSANSDSIFSTDKAPAAGSVFDSNPFTWLNPSANTSGTPDINAVSGSVPGSTTPNKSQGFFGSLWGNANFRNQIVGSAFGFLAGNRGGVAGYNCAPYAGGVPSGYFGQPGITNPIFGSYPVPNALYGQNPGQLVFNQNVNLGQTLYAGLMAYSQQTGNSAYAEIANRILADKNLDWDELIELNQALVQQNGYYKVDERNNPMLRDTLLKIAANMCIGALGGSAGTMTSLAGIPSPVGDAASSALVSICQSMWVRQNSPTAPFNPNSGLSGTTSTANDPVINELQGFASELRVYIGSGSSSAGGFLNNAPVGDLSQCIAAKISRVQEIRSKADGYVPKLADYQGAARTQLETMVTNVIKLTNDYKGACARWYNGTPQVNLDDIIKTIDQEAGEVSSNPYLCSVIVTIDRTTADLEGKINKYSLVGGASLAFSDVSKIASARSKLITLKGDIDTYKRGCPAGSTNPTGSVNPPADRITSIGETRPNNPYPCAISPIHDGQSRINIYKNPNDRRDYEYSISQDGRLSSVPNTSVPKCTDFIGLISHPAQFSTQTQAHEVIVEVRYKGGNETKKYGFLGALSPLGDCLIAVPLDPTDSCGPYRDYTPTVKLAPTY